MLDEKQRTERAGGSGSPPGELLETGPGQSDSLGMKCRFLESSPGGLDAR